MTALSLIRFLLHNGHATFPPYRSVAAGVAGVVMTSPVREGGHQLAKLWLVGGCAGQLVAEHLLAPGGLERGELAGEVLGVGRDAGYGHHRAGQTIPKPVIRDPWTAMALRQSRLPTGGARPPESEQSACQF
jgi:hypothetical protein